MHSTPYQQIKNILNFHHELSFSIYPMLESNESFHPIDFETQNSEVPGFKTEHVTTEGTTYSGILAYKLSNKDWLVMYYNAFDIPEMHEDSQVPNNTKNYETISYQQIKNILKSHQSTSHHKCVEIKSNETFDSTKFKKQNGTVSRFEIEYHAIFEDEYSEKIAYQLANRNWLILSSDMLSPH